MYDTISITKKGRDGSDFSLKKGYEYTMSEAGEIRQARANIPLNQKQVAEKTLSNGSIFIGYDYRKESLKVSVSLPKLVYGSSCYDLQVNDIPKALDMLNEKISGHVDTDIKDFNVFRLDNSFNMEMSSSCNRYISALNNYLPQKVGSKDKSTYQGETVRLNNGTETVMFYDKVNQALDMTKGHRDTHVKKFSGINLLRYEIQNKTPKGIEASKRYGRKLKVKDLLNEQVIKRTAELRLSTFDELFTITPKYQIEFETKLGILESMKSAKGRNAIYDFFVYLGLEAGVTSISEVAELMQSAGYNDKYIKRVSDSLIKLRNQKNQKVELIKELRERVYKKSVL